MTQSPVFSLQYICVVPIHTYSTVPMVKFSASIVVCILQEHAENHRALASRVPWGGIHCRIISCSYLLKLCCDNDEKPSIGTLFLSDRDFVSMLRPSSHFYHNIEFFQFLHVLSSYLLNAKVMKNNYCSWCTLHLQHDHSKVSMLPRHFDGESCSGRYGVC